VKETGTVTMVLGYVKPAYKAETTSTITATAIDAVAALDFILKLSVGSQS
jgi:hypothetical protein